jgi:cell wall-associated NlpC family hydrolase
MPEFYDARLTRPPGTPVRYQVTAGVAAIRATPAAEGEMVTHALHGESMDVFSEEGEFGLCQLSRDRYVGWVLMEAVSAPVLPPTHKVSALRTYCFSEPNFKSAPRFMLCLGARVVATGETAGPWVQCERAGWVHQRHLAPLTDFGSDPAGVAERYLETPYLWGGRESLGLDCSGLVQQAFEACGVQLPRDSDMQVAWAGQAVADWQMPGRLQRSDLVFWTGHVGILTAPDILLHANVHHLSVAREPLAEADARIRVVAGDITCVRRVALTQGQLPDWLSVD